MKYDTVIFDLDGTLLDTIGDLTNCANHTLEQYGYGRKDDEEIKQYIGYGIDYFLSHVFPDSDNEPLFKRFSDDYKSYYLEHMTDRTVVYPGARELIAELKDRGVKLGIVTNKFYTASVKIVEHFFGDSFEQVIGDGMGYAKKPDPEPVDVVMRAFGAERAKTLYVGDSEADVATAENAGIDCLIIPNGMRTREFMEKYGPTYMIDDFSEFLDVVN